MKTAYLLEVPRKLIGNVTSTNKKTYFTIQNALNLVHTLSILVPKFFLLRFFNTIPWAISEWLYIGIWQWNFFRFIFTRKPHLQMLVLQLKFLLLHIGSFVVFWRHEYLPSVSGERQNKFHEISEKSHSSLIFPSHANYRCSNPNTWACGLNHSTINFHMYLCWLLNIWMFGNLI